MPAGATEFLIELSIRRGWRKFLYGCRTHPGVASRNRALGYSYVIPYGDSGMGAAEREDYSGGSRTRTTSPPALTPLNGAK